MQMSLQETAKLDPKIAAKKALIDLAAAHLESALASLRDSGASISCVGDIQKALETARFISTIGVQ